MCKRMEDMVGPRRISYYGYSMVMAMVILAVGIPFDLNPESRKLIGHLFITFLVVVDFMFVRDCMKHGRLYRTRNEWVEREDHPYQFWYGISGGCIFGVLAAIVVAIYYVGLLRELLK